MLKVLHIKATVRNLKSSVWKGFVKDLKVSEKYKLIFIPSGSFLDLTCGTGSQVFFLNRRNCKCTGADFSPALLEVARKKSKNEKIDIKFIDGDMRTLKVGQFDAVITIFNAVGHLTKPGFEKAMKNIHLNLKKGGIYIFDILNLEAMTDTVVAGLT